MTNAINGTQDILVAFFKDSGSIGPEGLDVLHRLRSAAVWPTDGSHDSEDDDDDEILV